jgi:ATP-dependent helicase HrpA
MDQLKKIERLVQTARAADRSALIREIRRFRGLGPEDLALEKHIRKLSALESRVQASVQARTRRVQNRPAAAYDPNLPIVARRDDIIDAISRHPVIIVSGETGSGKTTQLPRFCLDAGRGIDGIIGCTQPRRIAAITVAHRIAEELKEPPGRSVGYKIRFQDRFNRESAFIKIMTDGILLAETQRDRYLNEYDTLIVDEAHERSLNIDFILGLLRRILEKRRDLKLIITSATIDTEKFSAAFGNAPVIDVSGRMYPVDVRYEKAAADDDADEQTYVEKAVDAVGRIAQEGRPGDILMFMPTEQDIRETCEAIEGRRYKHTVVLPLFARLAAADQMRVFAPHAGRKIIVATNVAETSITVPGIRYVVDTGLARISRYDPKSRTTALPVTPISKSSADQRMGRCGRLENGICVRLFTEDDYNARPLYTPPEILRANLSEVILRMIALDLGDIRDFPFVDPPPANRLKDGFDMLMELGAIAPAREGKKRSGGMVLTPRGRLMAKIPLDPRLSRMLIEARENGCLPEAAVIVSALTINDPRERHEENIQAAEAAHARFRDPSSDFITLYNIWKACFGEPAKGKPMIRAKDLKKFCKTHFMSFRRMREWQDVHEQIVDILAESGFDIRRAPGDLLTRSAALPSDSRESSASHDARILPASPAAPGSPGRRNAAAAPAGMPRPEARTGESRFSDGYAALHRSILSGLLSNIAVKKEKNIYQAARQRNAMIFPGSGLFNRAGEWIVAAEMVETSRLFARTAAEIDSRWIEPLGGDLCRYSWHNPRWERKREAVVADERVTLYGLVIVPARIVLFGPIDSAAASEIFIQNALVEGDVRTELPFMAHNRALMARIADMENRMRRRDLLAGADAVADFYRARLSGVCDMAGLRKKIKAMGTDAFLRMEESDLLVVSPDESRLSAFPDTVTLGGRAYSCAYRFEPGGDDDGVTVRVPATEAGVVPAETTDWIVPGLLEEKITLLIKALPKSFRKKLVPVADTVSVILREMVMYQGSLKGTLSRFLFERFGVDIPASAFSEAGLPEYLQMRLAVTDPSGKEIIAGRDAGVLRRQIPADRADAGFEAVLAKKQKQWERFGLTQWDFGDLSEIISVAGPGGAVIPLYPGLEPDAAGVNLRLFRDAASAETSHPLGVARLCALYFAKDIKHLKKSLVLPDSLAAAARHFGGSRQAADALADRVLTDLFARPIRTRNAFDELIQASVNQILPAGQALANAVVPVIRAGGEARSVLSALAAAHKGNAVITDFLDMLADDLTRVAPPDFISHMPVSRMTHLPRYIRAIHLRAERGIIDLERDRKKAERVQPCIDALADIAADLGPETSREKREAADALFWMIEEFKVSLFAQELKTAYPVSPRKIDTLINDIRRMI